MTGNVERDAFVQTDEAAAILPTHDAAVSLQ